MATSKAVKVFSTFALQFFEILKTQWRDGFNVFHSMSSNQMNGVCIGVPSSDTSVKVQALVRDGSVFQRPRCFISRER